MAFGGLLLAAVLLDDLADRVKLPGILLVLALGLLVDNDLRSTSEPLLSLVRADRITQSALVLVLFFGGLTTNWTRMKSVIRPAAWLASLGVLLTAGFHADCCGGAHGPGDMAGGIAGSGVVCWGHVEQYRCFSSPVTFTTTGRSIASAGPRFDRNGIHH